MAALQAFTPPVAPRPQQVITRLAGLRKWLADHPAGGLLIPRADPWLGEFIAAFDERLAWASGFTGTAGLLLVLPGRAVLFTDGRYLEQARAETAPAGIEVVDVAERAPAKWAAATLQHDTVLAYDPWLHSVAAVRRFAHAGVALAAVHPHPVDAHWRRRPPRPQAPLRIHPARLAGETAAAKRRRTGHAVTTVGADATYLTAPESVNWLLNIRGGDLPHTPVLRASAVVEKSGATLLLAEPGRLDARLRAHLGGRVRVADPATLADEFRQRADTTLAIDPATTPTAIRVLAEEAGITLVEAEDPTALPRACKNPAESRAMRRAHRVDGAAMVRFLAWLDAQPPEQLTEIGVVQALEAERRNTGLLLDIAFDTIAAVGAHAAMPHYRVSRRSNRALRRGELLLVDSGGQYPDGTTDITRTIALGTVPDALRASYTRVLQGMIAVSRARFPPGTRGIAIDAFARQALWQAGQDYAHGTGHGVGAGLAVHEGPFTLSPRGPGATRPLQSGIILSNEPGYYRPGEYGIRIENLVQVRPAKQARGEAQAMHAFETLTLVPIDTRPLVPALLAAAEVQWLNAYHQRVMDEIGPALDAATRHWLARACAPVGA